MADDLLTLTRFREVLLPEIERMVDRAVDARVTPLADRMLTAMDALSQELRTLRDEYTSWSTLSGNSKHAWPPSSGRSRRSRYGRKSRN